MTHLYFCLGSSCPSGEFLCPEGVCMSNEWLCDAVPDCSILSPSPTSHSLLPFGLGEATEEGIESCSKSVLEVMTCNNYNQTSLL